MTNIDHVISRHDPAARLRATPHWMEQLAAGVLRVPPSWLTPMERSAIKAKRAEIGALRRMRAQRRHPTCGWRRRRTTIVIRGISAEFTWDRYALTPDPRITCSAFGVTRRGHSIRSALFAVLRNRPRHYGPFTLSREPGLGWSLCARGALPSRTEWPHRPSRAEIAHAIRRHRAERPSPTQPDTLGWRCWRWDGTHLVSPHWLTRWESAELRCETWDESEVLRGVAGIHAHRMPHNWRLAIIHEEPNIYGVVERFGRYVLGTAGWRAEWVVIREVLAPTTEIGLALEHQYPEIIVHYPKEQ